MGAIDKGTPSNPPLLSEKRRPRTQTGKGIYAGSPSEKELEPSDWAMPL